MTNITTVPHLFAVAHGLDCLGPHRCFFCGAPCGEEYPAKDRVLDSFTGRSEVAAPGSGWVCQGCVLCMDEDCDLTFVDGSTKHIARNAKRMHSWIVTRQSTLAANKSHLARLRELCVSPPEPPYAIVLSDSGKRHLLYRGAVVHSAEHATVTLEFERVDYQTSVLIDLLGITGRISAAAGKPSLTDRPLSLFAARNTIERYRSGEMIIAAWDRERNSPLGRLARWLTPKKEDSEVEYPFDLH